MNTHKPLHVTACKLPIKSNPWKACSVLESICFKSLTAMCRGTFKLGRCTMRQPPLCDGPTRLCSNLLRFEYILHEDGNCIFPFELSITLQLSVWRGSRTFGVDDIPSRPRVQRVPAKINRYLLRQRTQHELFAEGRVVTMAWCGIDLESAFNLVYLLYFLYRAVVLYLSTQRIWWASKWKYGEQKTSSR